LSPFSILLPPTAEQKRIVAKLDKALLSRISKGENAANRALQKEEELQRLCASGNPPKEDKWKSRYQVPPNPDTSDFPEPPREWAWASLYMIAEIGSGISVSQNRVVNNPVVKIADSLESKAEPVDMVLTNPPFGKKSSFTVIGKDGKNKTDKISYNRPEFWATTSNKQLNFVQHVYSMLNETGRAAIVVPDNVLFEGGAGEKIRRSLLETCNVHTLLRLPTGIWYSPGMKANVLFFDKKPNSKTHSH